MRVVFAKYRTTLRSVGIVGLLAPNQRGSLPKSLRGNLDRLLDESIKGAEMDRLDGT